MAHRAGARLQHAGLNGLLVIVLASDARIDRVIRFNGDDLAILHAALDETCSIPTAVVVAGGVEMLDPLMALAQFLDYRLS